MSQKKILLVEDNEFNRKIVHDLINTIDGVTTTSEGEEPRRRVVILPSG